MAKYAFICLLLAAVAAGQTAAPAQPPGAAGNSTAGPASKVAPDAPVITLNGVCDHPAGAKPGTSCKKVITRAEFELMVQAVQPKMPASARRQLASQYVSALVMDQKARDMGLAQGADYEASMRIARLQVLAQLLNLTVYTNTLQVSDQQIDDYYHQNPNRYVEADLTRILIPGVQQLPAPKDKVNEGEEQKRIQESEDIMRTEADKLRARAVAGEDFEKLQAEAFQVAAIKDAPPSTSLGKVRGDNLPPDQLSVMGLKTGEISSLLLDKSGYVVYRVGEKRTLPLTEVRENIRATLAEQHRKAEMDAVVNSATPTFDETYFGKY